MPDVVPVDPTTVEEWTHPPYSGHYDGQLLAIFQPILLIVSRHLDLGAW